MSPRRRRLIQFASVIAVVAAWFVAAWIIGDPRAVPEPSAMLAKARSMWSTGELGTHLSATARRVIVGYSIGATLGVSLGAIVGRSRTAHALLSLPIRLLRSINPLALVPLVILWLGPGELAMYILISYLVTLVVFYNTLMGVAEVPTNTVRSGLLLGLNRLQLQTSVILPRAFNRISVGLRLGMGFALLTVVGAEMIGASSGLGFLIAVGRHYLALDEIFLGLILLGVLGIILNQIFVVGVNRLMGRYVSAGGRIAWAQ